MSEAISSIRAHIDAGFLTNEKLPLGPQVRDVGRWRGDLDGVHGGNGEEGDEGGGCVEMTGAGGSPVVEEAL